VEDIKLKFHAQKISEVLRNCTTARECIDTLIDYSFQVPARFFFFRFSCVYSLVERVWGVSLYVIAAWTRK
jgi:hypothetical protein